MNLSGTMPKATNIRPKTYTDASMASPHEVGVPFGRRLAYGSTNSAPAVDRMNENRNASFMPGHFNTLVSNAISTGAALPRELLHKL